MVTVTDAQGAGGSALPWSAEAGLEGPSMSSRITLEMMARVPLARPGVSLRRTRAATMMSVSATVWVMSSTSLFARRAGCLALGPCYCRSGAGDQAGGNAPKQGKDGCTPSERHACRSLWGPLWEHGAGAWTDRQAPCREASRTHPRGRGGHAGIDGRGWGLADSPRLYAPIETRRVCRVVRMARRTGSRSCLARLPLSGLEQDGPALDVDTRLSMGRGPCRDSNAQRAVVEASAHLCQQALSGGLSASLGSGRASGRPPAGLGASVVASGLRWCWGLAG